jgi:DNA-binding response OmpR family regulator
LVAHDGIAGLEVALKETPDLVILDLMLPGRDGYGVFKELRRDSRTSETPVIMLTARAQTEDRIQGLEAGADDYLTKPFSPKELLLYLAERAGRPQSRHDLLRSVWGYGDEVHSRTPLTIINGYIENLLEDDLLEDPATAKRFQITLPGDVVPNITGRP